MIRRVKWTSRATADHVSKVCIPFFVLLKEPIIYFKNCDLLTLFLSAGPALTLSIALLPAQKVQVSTWWIWLKWPINKIVNFGLLWFSDTCCRIKQDETGAETVEKQPVERVHWFFSATQIYAIPKMNSSGPHLSNDIAEKYVLCTQRQKHRFLRCGMLDLYQSRKWYFRQLKGNVGKVSG